MSLLLMDAGTCVEVRGVVDSTPYATAVHEVLEEGRILLNIPMVDGKEKRLATNKPYYLRCFSAKGVYRFTCVLCGYFTKAGQDYMLLQSSDDGEKVTSRQSFRLICSETTTFRMLDDGYVGPGQEGSIRDVSSGGVRLKTVDELESRQLLQIDLPMIAPDFKMTGIILAKTSINEAARFSLAESLFGRNVSSSSKKKDSGDGESIKYLWQYGIAFVGATDEEVERIIMHVHNEQQFTKENRPKD